jgi:methionine synthase II (cobalamin-independent)
VKLKKVVVGSFPVRNIPIEDAIKQIVDLQLKYEMELISDGEQRSDMLGYFESFPGITRNERGICVNSRINSLEDPSTFIKFKDLRFVKEYLEQKGKSDVKTKITVTGPITLGFFCGVNGLKYYGSLRDPRLYLDFADALNPLILEAAKNRCYIQIDEPSLTSRVMDPKDAIKIINRSTDGLSSSFYTEKLILHACGMLNESLVKEMMKLDAPILSLAFSAPSVNKNTEVISKPLLQSAEKKLGVGCISVQANNRNDVEDVDVVARRLKYIVGKVGRENVVLVHPDCGLKSTDPEAVEFILEHMLSAIKLFEE